MNEFNKMFIDTEELQSEIPKLKNSILNSLTEKGTTDAAVVKMDISNIKSSNEYILKSIKSINIKIADLYAKAKELLDKGDRFAVLESRINTIYTQKRSKDEELKRDITQLQKSIDSKLNRLNFNVLDEKIVTFTTMAERTTFKTKVELNKKIEEAVTKITNVESTSVNAIQIINAANKTLNEDMNKKN